jgi:predicted unusual protein kinase regulating ubiquinone biosynthesis (AarF/ABC1/UbiB family)
MNEVLSELPIYEAAGIPFSQMMERFLNTSLEFGIPIPHDFVLVSKALTTFEGTCLSLDPEIKIVEHLRTFVREYMAKGFTFDDLLKQLKAGPFELQKLKRLALKHGGRMIRFFDDPAVRIAGESRGAIAPGSDASSGDTSQGFIIAALILSAAILSNESTFEIWLRSLLHLPALPILPLAALAGAGFLWIRPMFRNRPKKGNKETTRQQ